MSSSIRIEHIRNLLLGVKCLDYKFTAFAIGEDTGGYIIALEAYYNEPDIHTGVVEIQHTRAWLIPDDNDDAGILQTALKCVLTSLEHRTRESFTYAGVRLFSPHKSLEKLMEEATNAKA